MPAMVFTFYDRGYVETLIDGAKNDHKSLDRFLTIAKHTDKLTLLVEIFCPF